MTRIQDRYWEGGLAGGPLRIERHFNGREIRCFSQRPATLAAMFEDLVGQFSDRPAIAEDRRFTYAELDRSVAAIASGLAAEGVVTGDRVALFLGNGWEFLACFFACLRIGAVVVPIGTRQRHAELEFVLNDCGANVLVFDAALAEAVPEAAALRRATLLFAVNGDVAHAGRFSDLAATSPGRLDASGVTEDDTAVILYTSGTTGRPKGALLTHLGIIHSALTFARCLGLTKEDRGLVAVPLSHVTGLVAVSVSTMIVGGCVVVMRQAYKTEPFLELASRERITFSILVPAIYTLCVMNPNLERYDLSSWRLGCFGGAPMPVSTIEVLAEKIPHLQLLNAYGATETTSPTTIMPRNCWREHMDSVGQVVPCGEAKVVDDDGRPVAPGEPGELWIRGPMVVPGYWGLPDADKREFIDGFWRSGDIGSIDADGFVRVFDRRKDMINRAGFKVFSAEVENVLSGLDGVVECAIVGRPDSVLGERVHAFVVVQDGVPLTADEVRDFCADRLSDYKVPESVTIVSEVLPRNANGKIQKALLRERLVDR